MILLVLLMGITAVIGVMTIEPLFTLMGADKETLPLIKTYMTVYYLGLVPMSIPNIGANALRATGDARLSGTLMVAGSVLQIMLAPILILGFIFPGMGLAGAAWGMVISRLCCVLRPIIFW